MHTRTRTLLFLSSLLALGLLFISGTHLAAQAPDPTVPATLPAGFHLWLPQIYNAYDGVQPTPTRLPAATIPATVPVPTIPATVPVPTIPAGQRNWLPQIYNMATASTAAQ